MKKSTKGAVAAAAAAVLLLGGAGSLAYWADSEPVTGGSINSGKLALINPTAGSWTLNGTAVPTADLPALLVVPGDELEFTGSFEIDAEGNNLQGTIAVTGGGEGGTLAPFVTTTLVGAEIDDVATTAFTEENDGDTLDVVVGVDFPFGTVVDNDSQTKTLDLTDLTVDITQTDATP